MNRSCIKRKKNVESTRAGLIKKLSDTETAIENKKHLVETLFASSAAKNKKSPIIEWGWQEDDRTDFVSVANNNRDVKFHKNFSSGTAVVRGNQPMENDQHFWELEMISAVYGTDVMVGIGTHDASYAQIRDRFLSYLGKDNKTWGLSYTGKFHHNGQTRKFSSRFGQGCTIGVHLDMWNGTLSYYKNNKYLGIASKGLTGKTLYPMASSTAASSGMRIIRSCSFPTSLQYLCCAKLRELIPDDKDVLRAIPLAPGLKTFLDNNLSWFLGPRFNESVLYPALNSPASGLQALSTDPLINGGTSGSEEALVMLTHAHPILLANRRNMLRRIDPVIHSPYAFTRRISEEIRRGFLTHPDLTIEVSLENFIESIRAPPLDAIVDSLGDEEAEDSSLLPKKHSSGEEEAEDVSRPPRKHPYEEAEDADNDEEGEDFSLPSKKRLRSYNYVMGLSDEESGEKGNGSNV